MPSPLSFGRPPENADTTNTELFGDRYVAPFAHFGVVQ
jgi:hypothetical protein